MKGQRQKPFRVVPKAKPAPAGPPAGALWFYHVAYVVQMPDRQPFYDDNEMVSPGEIQTAHHVALMKQRLARVLRPIDPNTGAPMVGVTPHVAILSFQLLRIEIPRNAPPPDGEGEQAPPASSSTTAVSTGTEG
jgi:hypothetical protein